MCVAYSIIHVNISNSPSDANHCLLYYLLLAHTPSTTVMEWFREGGVLLGALRERGGVDWDGVMAACVISRTTA